jgi:amino acid transporter
MSESKDHERTNLQLNGDATPPSSEPAFVRVPRRPASRPPDLELHETVKGSRPGTRFIRRSRTGAQTLRRVGEAEFEATKAALTPRTRAGRLSASVRGLLIGQPLATEELPHQRLSKLKALAVYSSDNVSSAAYATEEILIILMAAGTAALSQSIPITAALVALTIIVVTSYRQTIRAYPNGGGAYIVATDNLGFAAGLAGGSALLVDYIMTVAVSVAAGVAAITSAAPGLHDLRVPISLFFVALLTVGNLRGIRESGTIFAIPTYVFIFSFGGMLLVGLAKVALGQDLRAAEPANALEPGVAALTPFLLLRAFSSGAAALTGIEAVANGVPNFKPPEWRNAITTQAWMVSILSAFFVGTTILAHQFGIVPSESQTVISQIAKTIFGENIFYFLIQGATVLILVLAANTAFADLPVLASVMARDSVMPKQFTFRGDRLAFSNGIILLALGSAGILILFQAETTRIIPLYAFGVFTAFTLSQIGMVVHWRRNREPGWRRSLLINGFGGLVTFVVAIIVGATKFSHGAWISMAIMFLLILLLWRIHAGYRKAARLLGQGLDGVGPVAQQYFGAAARNVAQTVIIPVDDINLAVLRTAAYASSISSNTTAVHIALNREEAEKLREQWELSVPDVPFVIVDSPYRSLVQPLLAYIDAVNRTRPDHTVTVVLPEFVPRWPWERLLHNQVALRLKKALLTRPNTVIVEVPFHFIE